MEGREDASQWAVATRIAFRFACVFFLCVIFPFPLDDTLSETPIVPRPLDPVVSWVAMHVLQLSPSRAAARPSEFFFVLQLFTYLLVAAAVTLVWSLADRKRGAHPRVHSWMRLYMRFYLATTLLAFGSVKVFPYQFRPPSLSRLLQPLGDYDPGALMWAFIGSSTAYTIFSGAVEVVAGLLLLVPRLTTAGALLALAVLTNVFVLDMSYDVGVRTHCLVIMLMCGFLLAPDLRRLADVFVFNRPAAPAPPRPLFRSARLNQAAFAMQIALSMWLIGYAWIQGSRYSHLRDTALMRNPLRGIWSVEEFAVNGRVLPPLVTDPGRWRRVIIDSPPGYEDRATDLVTIQSMDGSLYSLEATFDLPHNTLELAKVSGDADWRSHFVLSRPRTDELVLDGEYDGQPVRLKLLLTQPRFTLTEARFQWPKEGGRLPFSP